MPSIARNLDDALAPIADGCVLAIPRESSGVAMAATRALVRRGIKNLHLIALPTTSLQADLLIGAGCVEMIETSAVSLGEFGPAPRFTAAVLAGAIRIKDATCPALHAGFQAAEKGVPFMPLRGLIGTDVLKHRPDWTVIDNPFGQNASGEADPIVLLPAIKPEVALFHAPMADRDGNVWIGRQRELVTMAHAAATTVITVEKIHDGNLLDDRTLAAGTLPGFYVESIAVAERGAWPLPLPEHYAWDAGHLAEYAKLAATEDGFKKYLERHVYERQAAYGVGAERAAHSVDPPLDGEGRERSERGGVISKQTKITPPRRLAGARRRPSPSRGG
jgi:glutaconate CoA-transferase, subunit A